MRLPVFLFGVFCLGATVSVAQEINVNELVFHGVNKFIEDEKQEALEAEGMAAELNALRHRILADPFPIPDAITKDSYFDIAIKMALKYEIPEQLFFNLVTAESNWDPVAVSHRGAIGLAQLMPGTASELGVDPWDAFENLDGGARYLRQQRDRFGSWELALAAYNAGPGAVKKYGGVPPYKETQEYVEKILGL